MTAPVWVVRWATASGSTYLCADHHTWTTRYRNAHRFACRCCAESAHLEVIQQFGVHKHGYLRVVRLVPKKRGAR